MKFYLYILYSSKLDRYYVGSTRDIKVRLERHLQSHGGFTSKAKDWELRYSEAFTTRLEAVQRELAIKKWKSRKLIEKLIDQSK